MHTYTLQTHHQFTASDKDASTIGPATLKRHTPRSGPLSRWGTLPKDQNLWATPGSHLVPKEGMLKQNTVSGNPSISHIRNVPRGQTSSDSKPTTVSSMCAELLFRTRRHTAVSLLLTAAQSKRKRGNTSRAQALFTARSRLQDKNTTPWPSLLQLSRAY